MTKPQITEAMLQEAAAEIGCSEAAIRAVAEVESAGSGFLSNGEPRILFEGHVFFRLTSGKYKRSHPDICYPEWDRSKYATGRDTDARGHGELVRLARAIQLDEDAALRSASVGRFQIMGDNCEECGFLSVQAFWHAMALGEDWQLKAFVQLIKYLHLGQSLRDRNWKLFARLYNGPGYAANKYDIKLATSFSKHAEAILARNKLLTQSTA